MPDNEWWRKSLIYKVELESVKSALDGNSNNVFKGCKNEPKQKILFS